jgi:hypothetical protein
VVDGGHLIFVNGRFVKVYAIELGEEAAARQSATAPATSAKTPEDLALFGGEVGCDRQPDPRELYQEAVPA